MEAEYADENGLGFLRIGEKMKGTKFTHFWDRSNHLGGKNTSQGS